MGDRDSARLRHRIQQVQTTLLQLWPLLAHSSFIPYVEISGSQIPGWSPGPVHASFPSHLHPTQGQAGEPEALGKGAELSCLGSQCDALGCRGRSKDSVPHSPAALRLETCPFPSGSVPGVSGAGRTCPCPFTLPGLVIKVSFQFSKERVISAPTCWSGRSFKERYWV